MTEHMREAMKAASADIAAMSPRRLRRELRRHENGDIARFLLESGAAELMVVNMRKQRCGKACT